MSHATSTMRRTARATSTTRCASQGGTESKSSVVSVSTKLCVCSQTFFKFVFASVFSFSNNFPFQRYPRYHFLVLLESIFESSICLIFHIFMFIHIHLYNYFKIRSCIRRRYSLYLLLYYWFAFFIDVGAFIS